MAHLSQANYGNLSPRTPSPPIKYDIEDDPQLHPDNYNAILQCANQIIPTPVDHWLDANITWTRDFHGIDPRLLSFAVVPDKVTCQIEMEEQTVCAQSMIRNFLLA
jgi:hypothetical protein